MNKDTMLHYAYRIQKLREEFDTETYFSDLPIDHCRGNFSEAIDNALEAVMQVYCELVLIDVQNEKVK